MAEGFASLGPKMKNVVVAKVLTGFVFGVYFYTVRAIGNTDELQAAIDKFAVHKLSAKVEASLASSKA